MDTTITAIVKKNDNVLGYCTKYNNYRDFENKINIPIDEDAIEIELAPSNIVIDTNKSIDDIFKNMVIGTPYKITGCCDGMDGQQLIYVGKYIDSLGTVWHMGYDGKYKIDGGPHEFGYTIRQLQYNDVEVIFNDNDETLVNKLQEEYSYLLAISRYV